MHIRVLVVCLCLMLAAGGLYAGQQATDEKGFHAGKAYNFNGIDSVNLFNGNLNIRVPLGGTYTVSENLSYSFALTYAGNTWDQSHAAAWVKELQGTQWETCTEKTQNWTEPSRDSNAGIGWLFTFGQLGVAGEDEIGLTNDYCNNNLASGPPQEPSITSAPDFAPSYLAPDGSVHEFHQKMRTSTPAVADTFYSTDSTYMRLKRFRVAGVPSRYELELANGNIHEFDAGGTITKMSDRFGNEVNITKDDPNAPVPAVSACTSSYESWTIDDGFRKHYAYFQTRTLDPVTPRREPYKKRLCQLTLASFASGFGAKYFFDYADRFISRQFVDGEVPPDATQIGKTVKVPILRAINLPDGTSYRAIYDIGRLGSVGIDSTSTSDPTEVSQIGSVNPGDFTGHLTSLTLPTNGEIRWTYKSYSFPAERPADPNPPYDKGTYRPKSAGVSSRRLIDGARDDEWTYTSQWLSTGYQNITSVTTMTAPDNTVTESFFTACTSCPIQANRDEYGLPVSRHPATEGPGPNPLVVDANTNHWMSSRTIFPDGRVRTTYVSYETESAWNPRVNGSTTVYENGDRSTVKHSDFDGLGHFRQSVTTGFGTTTPRTTYTNYNPSRGTYPTSTLPTSSQNWIVNNYEYAETTEGSASERTDFCFDSSTGFLNRKRVRRFKGAPLNAAADFLTIYRDGDAGGGAIDGNVSVEEFYGGDGDPLASTSTCSHSFSSPPFAIDHTHAYGVRATSKYRGMPHKTLDLGVDFSGLVEQSRDTAQAATLYRYDKLHRLTKTRSPAGVWTEYVYTNATPSAPASITVRQCPSGSESCPNTSLTESRHYYDGFGRLTQTRTRLAAVPTPKWTVTWMAYDAQDRVVSTSVPTLRNDGTFETMPSGTNASTSSYDAVGRVTQSVAPDGTCTDFGYTGAVTVTSSVSLGLCSNPARSSSTETFDVFGRLRAVDEGSGSEATHVAYGYSIDRMTSVSFGVQPRTFVYDGAGLLASETHPESGTTTFPAYNALGSVLQRRPADCKYNLDYEYDPAGRATVVKGGCSLADVLKQYTYGLDSVTGDKRLGKLISTVRWNQTPSGLFSVRETFTYGDDAGRLTGKLTSVIKSGVVPAIPIQQFEQSFQYDQLDALERASYPVCLSYSCGQPSNDGVVYTYSNGLLTSVSAAQVDSGSSFVPPLSAVDTLGDLSYHPTGQVEHIAHGNGVDDYLDPDPDGIPRLGGVRVVNFTECAAPQISNQPDDTLVPHGETTALTVGLGSGNYTYQWYTVDANDNRSAINGATSNTYTTPPVNAAVSYLVEVRSSCGATWSDLATVMPFELNAPTQLVAAPYGTTGVAVTWTGSTNAVNYTVERKMAGVAFTGVHTTTGTSWTDTTCPSGATCVYRVRANASGYSSDPSNEDLMTRIAFTSLTANNGSIKVAHLTELLAAVNALRAVAGSSVLTWPQILPSGVPAPAAGGLLENDHVLALRTRMDQALTSLGFGTAAYTDASLTNTLVKAIHIEQLRARTQ